MQTTRGVGGSDRLGRQSLGVLLFGRNCTARPDLRAAARCCRPRIPCYFLLGLTARLKHEKEEHHDNDHAFDVTRSALAHGNFGKKTMLGDCDCVSFQF